MRSQPSVVRKLLGFTVPVGLGAAALLLMASAREDPPRRPPAEQGRSVRVITVAEYEATPRATGYGVVRAQREWQLVAEVSGRVVEMNENLETGRILRKGEPLLKLDPQAYRITASQQKATVANAKAQLAELTAKERNTNASLKIAQRSLELAEKDYARAQELYRGGNIPASEVDEAERKVLSDKTTAQNLKNTLAELPASRRKLKALIDQYEAGVAGAELDISHTELVVPFDLRIRAVNVQLSELVTVGTTLAEGDGINVAEVPAQFSIGSLMPLVRGARPDAGASPRAVSRLRESIDGQLRATVRLESGALTARWEGVVDRFENIDSETRTVAVVVAVDKPFDQARIGEQPPLVRGMYVEVELRGRPRPGCRAVPRGALRGATVHVVGPEERLETRAVELAFVQDAYACVASGLEPGERVVLTNLVPAIEGMLLAPRVDEAAEGSLRAAVTGEEATP
ncbi:MAG: TolC family protein [Myxococcales bacterium]|nr:TolC family protein [Myxococcales bacterium]